MAGAFKKFSREYGDSNLSQMQVEMNAIVPIEQKQQIKQAEFKAKRSSHHTTTQETISVESKSFEDMDKLYNGFINTVSLASPGQGRFALRTADGSLVKKTNQQVLTFPRKEPAKVIRKTIQEQFGKQLFVTLGPDHSDYVKGN